MIFKQLIINFNSIFLSVESALLQNFTVIAGNDKVGPLYMPGRDKKHFILGDTGGERGGIGDIVIDFYSLLCVKGRCSQQKCE